MLNILQWLEDALAYKTKRKSKATTDSKHNKPASPPNLLERNFTASKPNRCFTYIPTNEDWLYLATMIDLYSRKIIGWSMNNSLKAELINNALLMDS